VAWFSQCRFSVRGSVPQAAVVDVALCGACTVVPDAVPGGGILLILVADRPFGIQFSSIVMYTAAVALYTFSRNRNGINRFCFLARRP
jgi:hypothetical protein